MLTPFNFLVLALVLFVGGHFFFSSLLVRRLLIAKLGKDGFRILYSAYASVALIYLIFAYNGVPLIQLWTPPILFEWLTFLIMPFACVLFIAGATTKSPTAIGGEEDLDEIRPVKGILSITRHPMLWGITLWAGSHLLVVGDIASLLLMASMLILSVGGMVHIDLRREEEMGSLWGPVRLTTSLIPFAAAITKRSRIDWRGIGLVRVLGGLALFLALLLLHPIALGVSAYPH